MQNYAYTENRYRTANSKLKFGISRLFGSGFFAQFYRKDGEVIMSISIKNQESVRHIGDYPDVLDVTEASMLLGVSTKTVYNLLKSGQIKKKKVGRAYRIPKVYITEFLGINQKGY